jgi:hypothetical protein
MILDLPMSANYRFLLRKLSITHDNLIFQLFEQNAGISTKSKYFFENSILKKETNPMFGSENVKKAMKTVPPISIEQLSIVNYLNKNH